MEYKEYLKKKSPELIHSTELDIMILARFVSNELMSETKAEEIMRQNAKEEKNLMFWNYIKRQPDILQDTINILHSSSNNKQVVNILKKAKRDDGRDDKYNFIENKTPLVVKIDRPTKFEFKNDDFYKLDPTSQGIGAALILNITTYDNVMQNRKGAEHDTKYMTKLWKKLGYTTFTFEGSFTVDKIQTIVTNFLKYFQDNKILRSCVVFIGGHGEDGILNVSNEDTFPIYSGLVDKLTDSQFLDNKPKIFIFQSCQLIPDNILYGNNATPKKDTILCFPTVPGDEAKLDAYLGSWFVYTLTDVFMREALNKEIREMLREVRTIMLTELKSETDFDQVSFWVDFKKLQNLYINVAPENFLVS